MYKIWGKSRKTENMNITTNVAGDTSSDNESTGQVPGPSAQSKSWKRSEIYFSSFVKKFDNSP